MCKNLQVFFLVKLWHAHEVKLLVTENKEQFLVSFWKIVWIVPKFATNGEEAANIIECLVNFKQNKRCLQKVCHFLAKIGKQVQRFSGKLIGCRKQLILVREENNNTLKERIQRIQSRYHIVAMEKNVYMNVFTFK